MKVHGKNTVIMIDGQQIVGCNTSSLTRGAGTENITEYGADDESHAGTLRNGRFTMGGFYDNDATSGPGALLRPKVSQTVQVVRRPEGTGTGKPEETFSMVLTSYVETNPVGGHVTWSSDAIVSGPITDSTQS